MQNKKLVKELDSALQKQCSRHRYEHSLRVAETCVSLAKHFGVEEPEARIAGLAHDMVREWPPRKLLKYATASGYKPRKLELAKPTLLHGRCAAILLKRDYNVQDASILNAVKNHTLGKAGMDKLGILLYVSDYIEPGRKYINKKFKNQLMKLSPWEMVIAVNKHAKKRHKKLSPLTRQLNEYARKMLRSELRSELGSEQGQEKKQKEGGK